MSFVYFFFGALTALAIRRFFSKYFNIVLQIEKSPDNKYDIDNGPSNGHFRWSFLDGPSGVLELKYTRLSPRDLIEQEIVPDFE